MVFEVRMNWNTKVGMKTNGEKVIQNTIHLKIIINRGDPGLHTTFGRSIMMHNKNTYC